VSFLKIHSFHRTCPERLNGVEFAEGFHRIFSPVTADAVSTDVHQPAVIPIFANVCKKLLTIAFVSVTVLQTLAKKAF
jgi:hypothetical protein